MIELNNRITFSKPGLFSHEPTNARRLEFDGKNEALLANGIIPDFSFIGDSIVQNWEAEVYFGVKNGVIVNRGISGDRLHYLLCRFHADVVQLKPRYTVIQIGINDTWVMDEPIQNLY